MPTRFHFYPPNLTPALRGRSHKNTACIARLNKRNTQCAIRDTRRSRTLLCKTNPIFPRPTMNLTLYLKRIYERYPPLRTMKNEPKTNPIQSQFRIPPLSTCKMTFRVILLRGYFSFCTGLLGRRRWGGEIKSAKLPNPACNADDSEMCKSRI